MVNANHASNNRFLINHGWLIKREWISLFQWKIESWRELTVEKLCQLNYILKRSTKFTLLELFLAQETQVTLFGKRNAWTSFKIEPNSFNKGATVMKVINIYSVIFILYTLHVYNNR
jgi:hypothetical protein